MSIYLEILVLSENEAPIEARPPRGLDRRLPSAENQRANAGIALSRNMLRPNWKNISFLQRPFA